MSDFRCEVVKIDDVVQHPNADRLKICKIRGFNCITSDLEDGSPRYKAGDYVVYAPEASILPDYLLKRLGFWDETNQCGTLSGSRKNRIKIIRLRGEYSQGIMYGVGREFLAKNPPEYTGGLRLRGENDAFKVVEEGEDVSEFLGITKYEPAIPQQMQGVVGSLFGFTKSYDIESLQNYPHTFTEGEEVVVTEKLHGTLCQIGFVRGIPEEAKENCYDCGNGVYAFVTSKGLAKQGFIQKQLDSNKDNVYVKAFTKYFVETGLAKEIADILEEESLYIFGEIMGPGIQSGYAYGKKAPEFRVFDIRDDNEYLDDAGLEEAVKIAGLTRVPVLYRGPFSMNQMLALRDGKTVEGNGSHIREGIVIRAAVESKEHVRGLHDGRKQVKFVSPAYKMKEDEEAFG